ncbi:HlyC/CorC family transporter [Dyadobacter frigoris]|uniref:HlyC/CorC family transporter n=2 Tax=Dyadobacter frigoris TaxID=2576211 RepID=A0A4U6CXG9_9BACT|nr:HlyC/CorC family transporter [Dyadobacter frigoris]
MFIAIVTNHNQMAILVIILLIILNGYFSLAEIALVSVTDSEMSDENFKNNPKAAQVLKLIKNPDEFLSAVQVGITLLGLVEGIYGGNIVAKELEISLVEIGVSDFAAHVSSLIVGIGLITYLTIVFGELLPKSIALQIPVRISLAIAPSLSLFSKIIYPFIKLLTVSSRYLLSLLPIQSQGSKKYTEKDLRRVLSAAYKQGILEKQQLWLHQNVITFKNLTAKRIMKPARIVAAVPVIWDRQVLKEFIEKRPYSYFPVFTEHEDNITGIVSTKIFLLNDEQDWQKTTLEACSIPADMAARDIFSIFKEKRVDFGIVRDPAGRYLGIIAMQDIMEGIFGDIPELEEYSDYFYSKSEKVWIAEGFMHLQRIRNTLSLPWLRDYEGKYLSLAELITGETANVKDGDPLVLNRVSFRVIAGTNQDPEKVSITLP